MNWDDDLVTLIGSVNFMCTCMHMLVYMSVCVCMCVCVRVCMRVCVWGGHICVDSHYILCKYL